MAAGELHPRRAAANLSCCAAQSSIGSFIEQVYNRQHLHSALAYRPPAEFETSFAPRRAAAQLPARQKPPPPEDHLAGLPDRKGV
jgi:hypothetical protein